MVLNYCEKRISKQCQGTNDVPVTTASVVFTPAGILAPVIAIFHTAPMVANEVQQVFRGTFILFETTHVVMLLRDTRAFLGSA